VQEKSFDEKSELRERNSLASTGSENQVALSLDG
jgi:hypothetical protein